MNLAIASQIDEGFARNDEDIDLQQVYATNRLGLDDRNGVENRRKLSI
jgi:hypothetical protein